MAKERLDLMVDGKVKRMLRNVAASEGISMSQLVEVMLTEHLSADGGPAGPTQAVADLLWIQRLQGEFEQAMELGRIHSFRNWVGVNSRKVPSEGVSTGMRMATTLEFSRPMTACSRLSAFAWNGRLTRTDHSYHAASLSGRRRGATGFRTRSLSGDVRRNGEPGHIPKSPSIANSTLTEAHSAVQRMR